MSVVRQGFRVRHLLLAELYHGPPRSLAARFYQIPGISGSEPDRRSGVCPLDVMASRQAAGFIPPRTTA